MVAFTQNYLQALGVARTTATIAGAANRYATDKKNQQFGRIETKVYSELKKAHNEIPKDNAGRAAIRNITSQLFDISDKQADLLFAQESTQDLVSGKGLIRLRFNNFKIKVTIQHPAKAYCCNFEPL